MQNELNFKQQKVWQVGITEQAKQALMELSRRNRDKGVPTTQGMIASALILRAYENGESVLG